MINNVKISYNISKRVLQFKLLPMFKINMLTILLRFFYYIFVIYVWFLINSKEVTREIENFVK